MDATASVPFADAQIKIEVMIPAGQWIDDRNGPPRCIVKVVGTVYSDSDIESIYFSRYAVGQKKDDTWKRVPSHLDGMYFDTLPKDVQQAIFRAVEDEADLFDCMAARMQVVSGIDPLEE